MCWHMTTLTQFLTSQGSLTARLESHFGQKLTVRLIFCGLKPLSFAQKQALNLPRHKAILGYVREVELMVNNQAIVWAVSVFALSDLKGDAKRLRYIKDKPIGYVLFKKHRHLPHTRTIHTAQLNRTTIYNWYGRRILIDEQFLDWCGQFM